MSLHRSLKTTAGALNQHRNVLTRTERIEMLAEQDKFTPGDDSPLGLLKVANRAVAKKKKAAKEETSTEETTEDKPATSE